MKNPWRYCKNNPPDQYVRCEIRNQKGIKYVGYRCGDTYYESIGNYIIKVPYMWRRVPEGSRLWETINQKIHNYFFGDLEDAEVTTCLYIL